MGGGDGGSFNGGGDGGGDGGEGGSMVDGVIGIRWVIHEAVGRTIDLHDYRRFVDCSPLHGKKNKL